MWWSIVPWSIWNLREALAVNIICSTHKSMLQDSTSHTCGLWGEWLRHCLCRYIKFEVPAPIVTYMEEVALICLNPCLAALRVRLKCVPGVWMGPPMFQAQRQSDDGVSQHCGGNRCGFVMHETCNIQAANLQQPTAVTGKFFHSKLLTYWVIAQLT